MVAGLRKASSTEYTRRGRRLRQTIVADTVGDSAANDAEPAIPGFAPPAAALEAVEHSPLRAALRDSAITSRLPR
jgi:hypothetical protein